MSRTSSDDQLNFVLKCVKHSHGGKVDFTAVAEECGIVSKGAAAKRYERLMKANGINPNGPPTPEDDDSTPGTASQSPKKAGGGGAKPKTPTKTPTKSPTKAKAGAKTDTPKKRKGGKAAATTSPTKKVKSEEKVHSSDSEDNLNGNVVKKEKDDTTGACASPLRSANDPFLTQPANHANGDDPFFKEFCDTGARAKVSNGEDNNGGVKVKVEGEGPTDQAYA